MEIFKIFKIFLYSCDIESLYTSIPIDLGIEAIDYWIKIKRNKVVHKGIHVRFH